MHQFDEQGIDKEVSTCSDITETQSVSVQILIHSLLKSSIVGVRIIGF